METRSDASLRKELDELREHIKQASEEARQAKEQATQAQEQATIAHDLAQKQSDLDRAKIDDLELALRVASSPSLTSPVPTNNLLSAITAVVPIDEHRLTTMSREFEGRLNDLHTMLTNDAVTREANLLQYIQALIASNVGTIVAPVPTGPHILPNVATVSTGPQISFNLAACQSNAKASQCQVEPELSQSVLNKSRVRAQPILPNVATVSTGPQISSNLAACQSNAKASQCQVEPELSQSVLNKSRVRARPILTCGCEYNISYPLQTTHPPGELYCIGNAGSWQSSRRESNAGGIPVL